MNNSDYVLGNLALNNYTTNPLGIGARCICPCHQEAWFSVVPPACWCRCSTPVSQTILKIISNDNSMTSVEVSVLRETINKLKEKIKNLEDIVMDLFKPSVCTCSICNGAGILEEIYDCPKCQGKGEYEYS